ncbi:MAG: glutamine amidotransferase [bacterium]
MTEFLLKYSPTVLSEGTLSFRHLPSLLVLMALTVGALLILYLLYRKTTLALNRYLKGALVALKFLAIALLGFILLEPIIDVSLIVPQKSSLILLVDDSKSMTIKDTHNKVSRKQLVHDLFVKKNLLKRLKKNFKIQMFKFSSDVELLNTIDEVAAQGAKTQIGTSLQFASEMASQGEVAAVVLFTDGVDNGSLDPLESAALLGSKKIPIYVVGAGSDISKDVEIAKVATNHSVIENSVVEISALIKNKHFAEQSVELTLSDGTKVLKKQMVHLSGTAIRATMKFSPLQKGIARYTLSVVPQKNEIIRENNSKNFLIDNRHKRARVLYVEGYPRAEFKYLRRAIDDDDNIELVSLLRTGPDKFYRQGIKNRDELKDGYPKLRKELFQYDAIIFGSVEAQFFSQTQLQNTLGFVAERGGGFLMLGGSQSFSQGGYGGTPIAKMLPVTLPDFHAQSDELPTSLRERYHLILTPDGLRHPILQLSSDESENKALWEKLPELEGFNPLGQAKPGATILAVHPLSEIDNPKIILANQRYGRGRTMVFATSSSWHWQMGMNHTDMSHERFWRQMLRWLALASPQPIVLNLNKQTFIPNEQVTLKTDVRDSTYTPIDDATIKAHIITPSGKIEEVVFHWASNGKVEYIAAYHPEEQGLYKVEVSAYSSQGVFLGKSESAFFVEESKEEFTNAQLQEPLLKRIAEVSHGSYYHETEAERLPDEIATMESSYSKMVEYDLWDVPLIFLLVILILCVEWFVRRSKGLS